MEERGGERGRRGEKWEGEGVEERGRKGEGEGKGVEERGRKGEGEGVEERSGRVRRVCTLWNNAP